MSDLMSDVCSSDLMPFLADPLVFGDVVPPGAMQAVLGLCMAEMRGSPAPAVADLALRHGPGHWPGLKARHLMDDALFPVAAPSLPGVDGIAGPGDLLAFPLLSDLALQGWPDWFRAAGLHGQRLPDMNMFNDSNDVMREAEVGRGIGLARQHIAAPRPAPA